MRWYKDTNVDVKVLMNMLKSCSVNEKDGYYINKTCYYIAKEDVGYDPNAIIGRTSRLYCCDSSEGGIFHIEKNRQCS